jgi:hypothetical protein
MLSGEGLVEALGAYAEHQSQSGAVLGESCADLSALISVLARTHGDAVARRLDWSLVAVVADVFYGDPLLWGIDAMTGCVSGPYLYAALHELYRRAGVQAVSTSDLRLVVVDLHHPGDLGAAISWEMATADVLFAADPSAEIIAHVIPGTFALVPRRAASEVAAKVRQALGAAAISSDVTVHALPASLASAWALVGRGSAQWRSPVSDDPVATRPSSARAGALPGR